MKQIRTTIVALLTAALGFSGSAAAGEFTAMGEYLILRQMKITGSGRVVEVPISFVDRVRGTSKMSSRIVVEAFGLVTWWALRDRVFRWRR